MKLLQKITDWLTTDWEKQRIHDYLASSTDTVDLERRMKQIDRGQAPWQSQYYYKARGLL